MLLLTVVRSGVLSHDALHAEPTCWNCRGFGHRLATPKGKGLAKVEVVAVALAAAVEVMAFFASGLFTDADGYMYKADGNFVGYPHAPYMTLLPPTPRPIP